MPEAADETKGTDTADAEAQASSPTQMSPPSAELLAWVADHGEIVDKMRATPTNSDEWAALNADLEVGAVFAPTASHGGQGW